MMKNDKPIRVGFIPLIDCAPFVIAHEKGFFLEEGVSVVLSKEASWASIRDKVAFNLLDGAHMLSSLPIAASLGIGTIKTAIETSFTVSQNGNGITLGNALFEQVSEFADSVDDIRCGVALKRLIDKRGANEPALRFAVVYPYSSHNYQLRDWLARAGIDPDKDLQIIVIAPPLMANYLGQGEIDGYCVGEPWNSLAVERGIGHMIVTGYEIWGNTPEKVFGVNSLWAEQNPEIYLSMIRALNKACAWVDQKENQNELLSILSHPDYLNCTVEQLVYGFSVVKPQGQFGWPMEAYQRFSGPETNKPMPSYALWLIAQMYRWQQLAKPSSLNSIVERVYKEEIYYQALGLERPSKKDWMLNDADETRFLDLVASGLLSFHDSNMSK